MAKGVKFDTSFNFGANAKPKKSGGGKAKKSGGGKAKGAAKRKSSGPRVWKGQTFGS